MGNCVSCTPIGKQRAMRVIFPNGEIRQFDNPITAAEVMLETPNFFLVNSKSLRTGKRFSALNADEDLKFANLYIMFPMKRVSSIITEADLGSVILTIKSSSKSSQRVENVKMLPEVERSTELVAAPPSDPKPVVTLDEVEGWLLPEFKGRLLMSRSKKPLLETIVEEPVGSRCSCIKL